MNTIINNRVRNAKQRIARRLAGSREDQGKPMFGSEGDSHRDGGGCGRSASAGSAWSISWREVGLVDAIDRRLHVLKIHLTHTMNRTTC